MASSRNHGRDFCDQDGNNVGMRGMQKREEEKCREKKELGEEACKMQFVHKKVPGRVVPQLGTR